METAPKEDRLLVFTDRGCTALAEWSKSESEWVAVADEINSYFVQDGAALLHFLDPTHWMPLPDPPSPIPQPK